MSGTRSVQTDVIDMNNSPMALNYMKAIRILLLSVGAWPINNISKRMEMMRMTYARFLSFQTSAIIIGEIYYMLKKFEILSFIDLGDRAFTLFITFLTLFRTLLPWRRKYKIIINKFVQEFNLFYFKNKSDYFNEIYNKTNMLSYYYTMFMISAMMISVAFFNLSVLWTNYNNNAFNEMGQNYTLQFSVVYMFPGFDPEEYFKLTTFCNLIVSYQCGTLVNVNDAIVTVIILQIIGHIKTLNHDLRDFPRPKTKTYISHQSFTKPLVNVCTEKYNEEENKLIRSKICSCINHHKFILSFTNGFSDFFGLVIGFNYLFQLLSCCLVLLECSVGDPEVLVRFVPLGIVVFFQLCYISVIFEIVGSESEKLTDAVYYIPWECMNVANQRTVCIFLHRLQTPVQVRAMGMTPVGVQTMLGILKTTFSYFTLLKSLNN